ncbi:phosphoglucomutase/phosphomannomutase family protein [Hydrogenobaculum sp.]|nr:MAG: phosphoglucomutase [Hydrogenobaculum sp.]HEK24818.1 phosphoglucomutase/phosphomannomutase family protein [Hydrogenobaculum sp.]
MIKFGTDGWRAIIGFEFSQDNIVKVAKAHAKTLKKHGLNKVIVGYDHRFLGERFAILVANVMKTEGIEADVVKEAVSTPNISFAVKYMGYHQGVMITASHNPYYYNGYKIKESFGGAATPEFINEVEDEIKNIKDVDFKEHNIKRVDIISQYIEKTLSNISKNILSEKELNIVHDSMYGPSFKYYLEAFKDKKINLFSIRHHKDALFGEGAPEPVEKNLGILKDKVKTVKANLGIANDGDGDRIALVDENGEFVNSQLVYILLMLHIIKNKGIRNGVVVKTVSTSFLVDRICKDFGIEVEETPVGFKYINEIVLKKDVIFGGEESGGYGFPFFLPERDGFLSGLFIIEMMLLEDKSLSDIIKDVFSKYGEAYYNRIDLKVEEHIKERLKTLIKNPPDTLEGIKVQKVNTKDGLKLIFEDDSWVMLRASGTEPLIRIYAEATSKDLLNTLLLKAQKLVS